MTNVGAISSEVRALRAQGRAVEDLCAILRRRGYTEIYTAIVLVNSLDMSPEEAAVRVEETRLWSRPGPVARPLIERLRDVSTRARTTA